MAPTDRIFTRIDPGLYGYTGMICRSAGDGLTVGRHVIPYGSRRTVRRALRAELRRWRRAAG